MRRALLICVLLLCCAPATALAGKTGGAAAPGESGGTEYGKAVAPKKRAPKPVPPSATEFAVTPRRLAPGDPLTFAYRIDGGQGAVRLRVDLMKSGSRLVAKRIKLGWKKTGRRYERSWTPAAGELAPGAYVARLHAVDRAGNALQRTASMSGRSRLEIVVAPRPAGVAGVFPVAGAWSWGGEDAVFGADRGERLHQGQDLIAAEGTPLVAPVAGSVFFMDYQREGAGHYVVIRGEDGRDYVFMHLKSKSQLVAKGDVVAAGQQFAQVGDTGRSSGAHLHFEIWPDGWYGSKRSQPIDPRPQLELWAAGASG